MFITVYSHLIDTICTFDSFAEKRNVQIYRGHNSELDINAGILGFVSEQYLEGTFQDAYNINCSIVLDQSSKARNMFVTIHEFAPFANSPEYCLYINSFPTPYACSGSRRFFDLFGTFDGAFGWKFSMFLKDSMDYVPKIRFWIAITSENSFKYFIFLFQ